MKICLISNLYPPIARGGAEQIAERIARGLRGAGHEVFVISTKPWGGRKSLVPTATTENGVKVYRFYPLNIFYYLNDFKYNAIWRMKWHFFDMFNFHSRAAVKKILKEERPEVVMTHNLKGIGYLIPGVIRKLRIKHIHTIHDMQLSVPSGLIIKGQENSWQQRTWLRKAYEIICRRLFISLDVVISPSKWFMDFHVERGFFKNAKRVILMNPSPSFASSSGRPENYAAPSGRLRLLYVGQIEEHKGILFLVNALKNIDFDFTLHIVGDGAEMEKIKKLTIGDNRFVMYGRLIGEPLELMFKQADLTLLPSLWYENAPNVIYESFRFGVPVIASRIGGIPEFIRDGENGFTFEAGNAEDLSRVLQRAAVNRNELQKLGQAAQKSVEDFRIENYIENLLNKV